MSRRKHLRESLKKRFKKILNSIWTSGDPLPEEGMRESPKVSLSKSQKDAMEDPLDLLIEKEDDQN